MEHTYEVMPLGNQRLRNILGSIGVVIVLLVILIFSSTVIVGGNEVGIVEKKLGGGVLPDGRILAIHGENGIQAQLLAPGWHLFYWPWMYNITKTDMVEIKEGYIGLIQSADGQSLPTGSIYAPEWVEPDKMIDAGHFLDPEKGNGYKGPQLTVLKPGKYRLNTKLFTLKTTPVVNVEVGNVAVIKSNVGDVADVSDRLVKKGQIGIWNEPLGEGQYYLNTRAYEVTMINIRQTKVSYTSQVERGERGKSQEMRPITVRSKDGYTFPVDVRMTYRIDRENAPRVVAMIGDDDLILDKLVTPRVRAVFRNNAEQIKTLDYVQNRSKQEQKSLSMLKADLEKYGVTVLEISIGDIGDEKTLGALLKTQTDREIALQEQKTFEEQQRAAEKQKALKRTQQEAEEEKKLAIAAYAVKIAEQDKQKRIIAAQAEAEQITLVAAAKANAYEMISQVIGADNAALIEIMKLVAEDKIGITPQVMVGGAGSGMSDALMGTILQGMLKEKPGSRKK